jgi:predicted dehydrogenase
MSELCSHQIHAINWFAGSAPLSVMGSGGIFRYKDGREVADHLYAIFEYPNNLTATYSSIQSNAYDHYYEEFMGTKGTIVLGGESEALLFMEGERGKPSDLGVVPDAGGPVMQASESRVRDAAGSSVGGAASGTSALNAYKLEIEGFARTIRNGDPNLCDGEVALRAATAILKADEAIGQGRRLEIGRELYTLA